VTELSSTSKTPEPAQTKDGQGTLARAAETLLQQARLLGPARCLALYERNGAAGPHLAASAGDPSQKTLRSLQTAAALPHTGSDEEAADGKPLILPLEHDGQAWGCAALALDGPLPTPARQVLQQTAQVLVENALLRQQGGETGRLEQLTALYEVGQAIHTLSVDEFLNFTCAKASDVLKAQACSLMMRSSADELVIRASHGLLQEIVTNTRIPRGHTVAWHVATSGSPVLLNESPSRQIGDLSIPDRTEIASSMCVPLRDNEGNIRGVMSARRMQPSERFTEEDLRVFSVFADQAALALSNAELNAGLTRRIHEVTTVNRLTEAINSSLDLQHVLDQIADCLIEEVGFDRCVVYLTDHRNGRLEARVARGHTEGGYPKTIDDEKSPVYVAAREQIAVLSGQDGEAVYGESPETGTMVCAPIVVRKQTVGVLVADNTPHNRQVETAQLDLLSTFVGHAGLAIENSGLYEAMEQKYAELNTLYEMSRAIGSAYGLDNAVSIVLEVGRKLVPCSSAAFALIDESRSTAAVEATRHASPEHPVPWHIVEDAARAELLASLRDIRSVNAPDEGSGGDEWQQAFARLLEAGGHLVFEPLIAEGHTVGVLMLARPEAFAANDVKLLSIISSHASVVIKNASEYERFMQEKVLEITALYDLSQRISKADSLPEALDSILGIVNGLVDCDESFIWAMDQESGRLSLKSSMYPSGRQPSETVPGGEEKTLAEWALRERKAVVLPDIRQESAVPAGHPGEGRVRSVMEIPLIVQDEVIGVLSIHSFTPGLYTEAQVRTLSVVATQAASIYRGLEALTALTTYTDNILASVSAGVVTLDTGGRVMSWNRAAGEILHVTAKEALGQDMRAILSDLAPGEDALDPLWQSFDSVFTTGQAEKALDVTLTRNEFEELHLSLSVSELTGNGGTPQGLVLVFEDVTRQVQMQDEVRRMGELAAIGQLAASIAHELRNPLSSIKGAAQLLQAESTDDSAREFLGIIVEEVDGLNRIASEFLDFARPLRIDPEECDLAAIVRRQMGLLSSQFEQGGIQATLDVEEGLPLVRADGKQVEQVFLNLALNAIQAMPDGGRLSVQIHRSHRWSGHVEISVRDTGAGIPEERRERIFTPFFTTKIKGTGLGLPVVQKIVQHHQGHIEVDSAEGEGACFRIHLPVQGPRPSLLGDVPYQAPDLLERS